VSSGTNQGKGGGNANQNQGVQEPKNSWKALSRCDAFFGRPHMPVACGLFFMPTKQL
jgi:hypothetical protein